MRKLSVEDATKRIGIYLTQKDSRPYFVIADGVAERDNLIQSLSDNFVNVYISRFCGGDFPLDVDLFVERLKALEKTTICFGLGEYVYFTGQENILRMLVDKNFNCKIIFICRGVSNFLERLANEDLKFRTNRICKIGGIEKLSVIKYSPNMPIATDAENFTELLEFMEKGTEGVITVKSELPLLNVKEIRNFYDAIKNRDSYFTASSSALSEDHWREYFFDSNCEGYPPEHWRTFAASFTQKISNSYLRYITEHSANYEKYLRNLLFALLDVEDEKLFLEFYWRRKEVIKNVPVQYLAEYLRQLKDRFTDASAIKYLTDNTFEERRAMIEALQGANEIPKNLCTNYAAMKDYLAEYDFGDAEITSYFQRYKEIKVCNVDDADFKKLVQDISLKRPSNRFATRQAILERVDKTAKLYWLDALGVEFASYIKARATQAGLDVKIEIARAELPTLTAQNKNFYDEWQGDKFIKNSKLDELKHSPEKFEADGKCSAPTYLCDELVIIDDVLEEIKIFLTHHRTEKVVLTSDHGASRPAVMYGHEIKYKMFHAGEHSGRCCPISEVDEKPASAVEENGYWSLANYDRFAGGRLASVEVHGGATLEEILIPVVELALT